MPEPIIQLKNLDITYNLGKENEFKASKNINMEIYPGEFVAFFGPSGCGKSTIFYSILGILEPSAGQLLVKGENPYALSPNEMVMFQTKIIGIMYQAFYLIPSLSVIDNVSLPQIFHGVPPAKRREWALQLLTRFDMGKHGDKYPENLSGGQSQRVSVARSLVNNPDIILADEPTGNLDSISTKQVMEALETINKVDKKTIIIITHNAAQLSYAHRVFYLKDGKLQRIVPNPDKKQIAKIDKQKILVTEMDQLSKLYPYATPDELKVKSLVNYLTQDFNFNQLERMEKFTKLVIERKMSKEEFRKVLCRRYHKGGVGTSPSLARVMAEKVDIIIHQGEDARRFRRRFTKNNFFSREHILIKNLSSYLIKNHKGNLLPIQKRRIKELVYKRIAGLIKRGEFQNVLLLKMKDGGVGLNRQPAKRMTFYFEKLLIQGSETKGHGH